MDDCAPLVVLAMFALVGVWAVVDPGGIIGWAKSAHPILDQNDPSTQSVAKFIGVWFIVLSGVIFIAFVFAHQH
jgi:hypothetical protein